MTERLKVDLLSHSKDSYGPDYRNHLLEQYKLYLELIDRVSARRQTANSFFLTVETALLTTMGLVWPKEKSEFSITWFIMLGLAGMLVCFCWYQLVKSYRDLNGSKFLVLHEIEEHLPIKPYSAEWKLVGSGENRLMYLPITHVEIYVPWVFLTLFLALVVLAACRVS